MTHFSSDLSRIQRLSAMKRPHHPLALQVALDLTSKGYSGTTTAWEKPPATNQARDRLVHRLIIRPSSLRRQGRAGEHMYLLCWGGASHDSGSCRVNALSFCLDWQDS